MFYRSGGRYYAPCKVCHNRRVRRWQKTPAGKLSVKERQKEYKAQYERSKHGKAVIAAYRRSEKYQAWQAAYNQTEAGKGAPLQFSDSIYVHIRKAGQRACLFSLPTMEI